MTGVLPLRWRQVRWVLAAVALPVIWACNSPPLGPPTPAPERVVKQVFQAAVNRDVDILFMIDNSPSMRPLQAKLATNFPTFMNVLNMLPGGLPNVHIAVVSSDMGAGGTAPTTACRVGGDGGVFRSTANGNCMTGLPADQHYLSSINGMKNFTGDIASAFSCIAQIGDQGCGFEHQFASVLKALEPNGLPGNNNGFLRTNAYLSIIMITNEDDCSAPGNSDLFDPKSQLISDSLGPLASYRCNEYGHLCGAAPGTKPPRTEAMLTNCVPNEDGRLLKVSEVIARTKALKPAGDEAKILVAAVAAEPTPYRVVLSPQTTAMGVTENQPGVGHSCTVRDGTYGDPAIRIKTWVEALNGTFVSICDDTFSPALMKIAEAIGKAIGPQCVEGKLVDTDKTANGVQPECIVSDVSTNAQGNKVETPVPACGAGAPMPCWEIIPGSATCKGNSTLLKVNRAGDMPSNVNTNVSCAICIPGVENPGC